MKERQNTLKSLLIERFGSGNDPGTSVNPSDLEKGGLLNEVNRTYLKLSGISDYAPLSFGKWDIILNGFIVELDEEQHFNRYREITLRSFIYHVSKGFDLMDYMKYCRIYENECLRKGSWGKYWTSPSTEHQFGLPGERGDLSENGSPRWKQRAFYDYLRDVFALTHRIPVIRISIYDRIIIKGKIRIVNNILNENSQSDLNEMAKFIEQKVNQVL